MASMLHSQSFLTMEQTLDPNYRLNRVQKLMKMSLPPADVVVVGLEVVQEDLCEAERICVCFENYSPFQDGRSLVTMATANIKQYN